MKVSELVSQEVLASVPDLAVAYRTASPFRHLVIDNFLFKDVADFLAQQFPKMENMPTVFKEPMSYKGQLSGVHQKWPQFSDIFNCMQSVEFRNLISQISGIQNLIEDPIMAGGGLHLSPRSGFLDIHVDANFHPKNKQLHRRINILIYVTKNWDRAWGGGLQLWSDKKESPDKLVELVEPKFNRAVIFSTTRTSWHGVEPINCPDGVARQSLALYYYTNDRPEEEIYKDTSVIWMNRTVTWKRAIYPLMNFAIATLKPYIKRKKAFDAAKE
jgi:Rps23 Pro-64 3,4-dihydroxylase Tpa1-like proline 4-hydroxylase